MIRQSSFKAAAAALTLAAVALPGLASAQSYDYRRSYDNGYVQSYDNRDYNYDCRDSEQNRQAGGAVIGGAIGAIAGSQVAARGRRTEGSVLGGVLGAVVGAAVGGDSANCRGQADRYDQNRYGYDQRGYDQRSYGYDQRAYDQRGYGYDGYDRDRRYDDRRAYDYQQNGYGYDRNGCRSVETRQQDRYGRVVVRTEQVCRERY